MKLTLLISSKDKEMIVHSSFRRKTGLEKKSIMENQELVRIEAETFIRNELNGDQIVNMSEVAVVIPLGMRWTIISITIWY
jgi:hypothetical protein